MEHNVKLYGKSPYERYIELYDDEWNLLVTYKSPIQKDYNYEEILPRPIIIQEDLFLKYRFIDKSKVYWIDEEMHYYYGWLLGYDYFFSKVRDLFFGRRLDNAYSDAEIHYLIDKTRLFIYSRMGVSDVDEWVYGSTFRDTLFFDIGGFMFLLKEGTFDNNVEENMLKKLKANLEYFEWIKQF